ncbi:MAG TPA: LuxR C-terminal-related transcriptional regulator, partial [Herpetosiphonaceae bacterium]|nr:LuxR C-terminal-related transcriptional regulator [Herpetosiphonaceae bacterium]
EEVLRHEDAAIREFLLETSVLTDLTPALCAAVSGRADAAPLLADLYRRNLFVVAVDPAGRVLRYQPLFAAFLCEQRDRAMPERVAELHRRAARAEPGPERAIPHYLAAAEWPEAAGLIERIGEQWLQHGLVEMVGGWIAALPDAIRQRPSLRYLLGLCAWRMGRPAEAGDHLAAAVAGLDGAERDAALAHLADWAFVQGDFTRSAALIEQARPDVRPPATRIRLLLGRFRLALIGRAWVQALAHFDAALAVCERSGDPAAFAQLANLVNITMIAGLPGGIERLERVVRWGERWPAAIGPTRVALETQAAVISLWRGDLAQALTIGAQALDLSERLGGATPYLDIFLPGLVGILRLALGDDAAADRAFATMLGCAEQGLVAGPLVAGAFYNIGRARWIQGRLAEARQFHQRLGAIDASAVPLATLLATLLGGLLAMAEGRLAEAERSLRQAALMEQMAGPPVRALACPRLALACFYERSGRPAEALAEFGPLLEECAQEGRLGLILREGAAVIPLLRLAAQQRLQADFVADLLGRLGVAAAPRPLHNPATGATLSPREVEVLGLIAAGASNKEIAAALVISAATVKTHLLHIFQKLDVRTRTQAVARARELRLP